MTTIRSPPHFELGFVLFLYLDSTHLVFSRVKSTPCLIRDSNPERPHDQLRAYSKASFTHIVNVTVSGIVSGTFDLFDGHFDEQNGRATHFAHHSVPHHWQNF